MTNFTREEVDYRPASEVKREHAIIGMALRYMLSNLDDLLDAFTGSPHSLPMDITEEEVEAVFNKNYMSSLHLHAQDAQDLK